MKTYSVRVDGYEIDRIEVESKDCKTQEQRNEIRGKIAKERNVPRHYIKLYTVEEDIRKKSLPELRMMLKCAVWDKKLKEKHIRDIKDAIIEKHL